MKHLILTFFSLYSFLLFSQNTIKISEGITLNSNTDFANLIDLHKQKNENTDEIPGYRIQIISDNNRAKVYEKKAKVYQQFSEFKSYLKYEQPYYKLRIGDFKTRLEARSYLARVIQHFPSAFIVFDQIKVR